jgi:tetratricopeptide (TPR) repeat protein
VPWHEGVPYLPQIVGIQRGTELSAAELDALVKLVTAFDPLQSWPPWMGRVALLVHEGLVGVKRLDALYALAPGLWRMVGGSNDGEAQRRMTQATSALMDAGEFDLGGVYSTMGTAFLGGGGVADDCRNALQALRSRAKGKLQDVIPVGRDDRRYPIFAAQADFLSGKFENAMSQVLDHRDLLMSEYKELDPAFSLWVLEGLTEMGNHKDAEALAQTLIQWVEATPQGFDPEMRAHLLVSYADISFSKQEYPRARAQYERITAAPDLDGTLYKKKAEMKMAEVDRVTKNYDRAMELLEKIAARKEDTYVQTEANYLMALIKKDQEDYDGSMEYLQKVFSVNMNHANALILQGKVFLLKKKLEQATHVPVGLEVDQQILIPGKTLRVQLNDRNLAVVGKAQQIEVRVWTDSGDEEFLRLLPFGDSKDQFQGQISTAMGPIVKGDRVLQVLGSDYVHYEFSDRFKKKKTVAQ